MPRSTRQNQVVSSQYPVASWQEKEHASQEQRSAQRQDVGASTTKGGVEQQACDDEEERSEENRQGSRPTGEKEPPAQRSFFPR